MQGIGVVLVEPVITVEEEELFAPQHAGEGLTHHAGLVFTHRRWRDRLVELIGFTKPLGEEVIERLAKGLALRVQETAGEPQANHARLTGADRHLVVGRDLGAVFVGIDGVLPAVYHTLIDAVFNVGALVLSPEQPGVVGFVVGEEERHVAFA